MKLKAKADILFGNKKLTAGSVFEADTDYSLVLIETGMAEAVEEKKTPKKTAKKK